MTEQLENDAAEPPLDCRVGHRASTAARLAKRLEREFDCKITSITSNHRSKGQAAQGVWSWCAEKLGGGTIGSEDTMTQCLRANNLHPEPHASSWPSFRDTHVTAVPNAQIEGRD